MLGFPKNSITSQAFAAPLTAFIVGLLLATSLLGCNQSSITVTSQEPESNSNPQPSDTQEPQEADVSQQKAGKKMETATFGAGCFWCVESVFLQFKGVKSVKSGYMGGNVDNPTYKQVCNGTTGHAEVVQIEFDPSVISFDDLLQVFWKTHDPTTLNRQGNDIGTQYRSVVFFHSKEQERKALGYKKKLNEAGAFDDPIVTEITAASKFYVAEDYHQDYFNKNPSNPYCRLFIPPKLEKLKKVFADKLKDN